MSAVPAVHRLATSARVTLAAATLFALAACSGDDAQPGADAAAAAQPAPADAPAGEFREAARFRLSMNLVDRYVMATENLHEVYMSDPSLRDADTAFDDETASLPEIAAEIRSHPAMRRAIERAGISVEDYVLTGWTVVSAGMVVGMREMGVDPGMMRGTDWVQQHHVDFFEANRAAIEAAFQRLEALEADDDGDWD